ncbi:MAG: AAA family ATPase [Pseudohongiellaceae bacterium]
MNSYVDRLGLDFDPFEPGDGSAANHGSGAKSGDHGFFAGGSRQTLLQELMEQACHSGALLAVTGEPGAGKSTLARQLARDLGKDAVCAVVPATLFMDQAGFLDQVRGALGLSGADSNSDAVLAFANDLALDARTLVLIIDDAQELSSEVHGLLTTMLKRNPGGGLAVVMFGEPQLSGLLQRSLPPGLLVNLVEFSLPPFTSEDSLDYIRFKLGSAGFRKPLPLNGGELGQIHLAAAGLPGALNQAMVPALVAATTPDPQQRVDTEAASLFSLGRRYWLAAGSLLGVLLVVLLLPTSADNPDAAADQSTGRQQIAVSVDSGSGAAQPAATVPAPAQASQRPQSTQSTQSETPETPRPVAQSPARSRSAAPVSPPPAASLASSEPSAEQPATAAPEQDAQRATERQVNLSGFEQRLLSYPAQHYAVQIMGSRSADNIRRFLDSTPDLNSGGYFATTYQGQPWYVVVSGQFADRGSAEDAIAALPDTVRELNPWVRSLADIQASIRSHYQLP